MARYILLEKEQEDESSVTYRFGPSEAQLGRLRLDKHSGVVDEVDPVPIDTACAFFSPAAVKLRQHWRKGIFPERTSWAS